MSALLERFLSNLQEPQRWISFGGYFCMIGLAWLLSGDKRRFPWRTVIVGTLLQFVLAVVILDTKPGLVLFDAIGTAFKWVSDLTDVGSRFVFGEQFYEQQFAFKVL